MKKNPFMSQKLIYTSNNPSVLTVDTTLKETLNSDTVRQTIKIGPVLVQLPGHQSRFVSYLCR